MEIRGESARARSVIGTGYPHTAPVRAVYLLQCLGQPCLLWRHRPAVRRHPLGPFWTAEARRPSARPYFMLRAENGCCIGERSTRGRPSRTLAAANQQSTRHLSICRPRVAAATSSLLQSRPSAGAVRRVCLRRVPSPGPRGAMRWTSRCGRAGYTMWHLAPDAPEGCPGGDDAVHYLRSAILRFQPVWYGAARAGRDAPPGSVRGNTATARSPSSQPSAGQAPRAAGAGVELPWRIEGFRRKTLLQAAEKLGRQLMRVIGKPGKAGEAFWANDGAGGPGDPFYSRVRPPPKNLIPGISPSSPDLRREMQGQFFRTKPPAPKGAGTWNARSIGKPTGYGRHDKALDCLPRRSSLFPLSLHVLPQLFLTATSARTRQTRLP